MIAIAFYRMPSKFFDVIVVAVVAVAVSPSSRHTDIVRIHAQPSELNRFHMQPKRHTNILIQTDAKLANAQMHSIQPCTFINPHA